MARDTVKATAGPLPAPVFFDFGESMNTTRRTLLGALAASGMVLPMVDARAQNKAPDAGIDYKEVTPPQATESGGKIEVLEFFWYGCPHCYAFEPSLVAWAKKLPADVTFRRVHAQFTPQWVQHAKLFYAIEALSEVDRLHRKIFDTIHGERRDLLKDADMLEWAAQNGIDKTKFSDAFKSFGVAGKLQRARQIVTNYKIEGVPMMAINGKFVTSPSIAGGQEKCLAVADFLIDQERRAKKA